MHIEARQKKKRIKYYLAHSFRDGKTARKVRIYLGQDLSRNQIAQKKKDAARKIGERIKIYKVIRNPLHNALSTEELNQIKTLEARGKIKITHLSEGGWKKFGELFTYDTNAIEGSTVTLDEVEDILEKNKWPQERQKWEVSETYGVAEAIVYIRKTKEHISLDLIKEIHKIIFKNSKDFAGNFRSRGVEVAVVDSFGTIVSRGAPSFLVEKLLKELVNWYNKSRKKYPPLLLAAVVHNQFETIHPFKDGNGRVGRILLNNILLKHNLPPVNIQLKNRAKYYRVLQEYQNNGNVRPMIELILNEYRSLKKLLKR